jgi:crotonobetainyl-CoA:carnitine CoA-transferase CaiB-like acyl-CoA transferase
MTVPTPPELPLHEPRGDMTLRALDGLRVIDFTHFIAGPFCTMLLADLGAEVIKIENAANGDDFRRMGPQIGGQGAPFLWANRNKLGLTLDLSIAAAREVARELIAGADVVVENFTAGVMQRFGLDYVSLAATNPKLIYCSVSAFRRDGHFASRAGFDPMVQAESGFMSMNGYPDRPGTRTGPAVMDISTAMMACNAILAALAARSRYGKGQQVEVSLFDTAAIMVGFHAMNYLMTGVTPNRFGNESPDTAPMGVFATADGPLYVACANDRTFQRLVSEVLQRSDLAASPDYATNYDRVRNKRRLTVELEAAFAGANRASWSARMTAAGVPVGIVRTIAEAYASEEHGDSSLATRIPHPTVGIIPNIASPLRLGLTPVVDPVAAPTLGQHNLEIMTRILGYDDARVAALAAAGVFGSGAPTGG